MLATDSLTVAVSDSLKVSVDTLAVSVESPDLEWDKTYKSTPEYTPDYLFVPLVFEMYSPIDTACHEKCGASSKQDGLSFDLNDKWLKTSIKNTRKVRRMRYTEMIDNPQNVQYNQEDLPVPPKTYIIAPDPSNRMVTIEERKYENVESAKAEAVKVKKWIHSFNASVQLSQAYLSDNWYQGGENNVNVIGNFVWNVKLNENVYKKLLFENTVQYKVSVNSAPQDSLRGYSISQDLFQINTKFGYKAIEKWYYSATMRFKTQLFNNYKANTNTMKASFLSPAELNLGLGMTYSTKSKDKTLAFDMSLSPLSIDMNICR